jgi:hypothetical protein
VADKVVKVVPALDLLAVVEVVVLLVVVLVVTKVVALDLVVVAEAHRVFIV